MENEEYFVKYQLVKLKSLNVAAGCWGNQQEESHFITNNMENRYEKERHLTDKTYTQKINDGTYRDIRYDNGVPRMATHHSNDSARVAFANDGIGYGIFQSTAPKRKLRLYDDQVEWANEHKIKFDISNRDGQAYHAVKELTKNYTNSVYIPMTKAPTIKEASDIYCQKFEVPQGYDTEPVLTARFQSAVKLWSKYFNCQVTFWFEFLNEWYYVQNGYLRTSCWEQYEDKWYYLNSDGCMVKSKWLEYKDGWYYVNGSGIMLTEAWIQNGGKWYYLNGKGKMETNKIIHYKGDDYYLQPDGSMAEDCVLHIDNFYYKVGKDGVMELI